MLLVKFPTGFMQAIQNAGLALITLLAGLVVDQVRLIYTDLSFIIRLTKLTFSLDTFGWRFSSSFGLCSL